MILILGRYLHNKLSNINNKYTYFYSATVDVFLQIHYGHPME